MTPTQSNTLPMIRRRRSPLPLQLSILAVFCCGVLLNQGAALERAPSSLPTERVTPFQWVKPVSHFSVEAEPTPSEPEPAPWYLLLVNRDNPLPEDFSIPELTQLKYGHAIDSRAYPSLQAMLDGARAAGYDPLICSSYRTQEKQEKLFTQKVRTYLNRGYSQDRAEELAAGWVSPPGTSEHQAGLSVDIVDREYQVLNEEQEKRPVQQWLMAHCAEYGFILRYPTGKSDLTGVNYEPWHYRYVGEEAAQAIMSEGLCLEEYLADLAS